MKILIALLALLIPAAASAQPAPLFAEIREGSPVSLDPDKAYILFRTDRSLVSVNSEPVFLREPVAAELAGYEAARRAAFAEAKARADRKRADIIAANAALPVGARPKPVPPELTLADFAFSWSGSANVFFADFDRPFVKGVDERVFLIEATSGSYVLLGVDWEGIGTVGTCFCFGTVRFAAAPGRITDLGYFFGDRIDKVSKVPELAPVTGHRDKISPDLIRLTGAIRPYAEGMPVPAAIAGLQRVAADYRAVGKFPNKFATDINRLPPMPGILAYDRDQVIDVRAGNEGDSH